MREIKFRVWDNIREIMMKLSEVNTYSTIDIISNVFKESLNVMQYTGLLDKNGREIYEGDIMVLNKLKPIYYVVKYKENGFVLDGVLLFENAHYFTEREVVGNTFENPELLEN